MAYFWSALFPPGRGVGERPVFCVDIRTPEDPSHEVAGFICVASGHEDADCNQHGGWVDMGMMMEAFVETFRRPGCDVRLFVEPLDDKGAV